MISADPTSTALANQAATAAAALPDSAESVATTYSLDSRLIPTSILDRKHADWSKYSRTWDDLSVLYDGATDFRADNTRFLQMRPKEPREIYQARSATITYSPILTNGIGWYLSKLFENDPAVDVKVSGEPLEAPNPTTGEGGDPQKAFYDSFFKDCDNAGTAFFTLARDMYQKALVYRRCFITLDLPQAVNIASNRADQEKHLKPYLTLNDPRSAINWSEDTYGNLNWIVFYSSRIEPAFLKPAVTINRWTYYDLREYRVFEQRSDDPANANGERMAQLVDSGFHAMADYRPDPDLPATGRVPVVVLEVPKGLWLAEKVMLQVIDHLNTENALKWGLYLGCLAQPIITSEGEPDATIAEHGLIHLHKGDTFGWAEPTGTSFKLSAERLECLREEIYRSMYLQAQGRSTNATASAQSGYSKEMDMAPAADVMNAFGKIMRDVLQLILYCVAAIRQDAAMDFDVRGLAIDDEPMISDLTVADQLLALQIPSPTFEKEVKKGLVRKYGAAWNKNLLDECCEEIDKAPTQQEIQTQQQEQESQLLDTKMQLATAKLVTKNSTDLNFESGN